MHFDILLIQVLVNVISGGLTPSFTYQEAEKYGAKIISSVHFFHTCYYHWIDLFTVFSLVSSVAMVHAVRSAMASLKKTGTDFVSAKGMDPRSFFEVMGTFSFRFTPLPHSKPPSQV
jgi:hypothetical protein